jgi:triosephosphate isomerase
LEQREQEITEQICRQQILAALEGIEAWDLAKTILAYEPVWAIGTGRTATPEDAQSVISFIRGVLGKKYSEAADKVRILYGGSVKSENIDGLMAKPDIDGALVGGASLDAQGFARIVKFGG